MASEACSHGEERPPLPPRPSTNASSMTAGIPAPATTAITPLDVQTLSFPDGSRGTFSAQDESLDPSSRSGGQGTPANERSSIEVDDAASALSRAPTGRLAGDIASLLAGETTKKSAAWTLLRSQSSTVPPFAPARIPVHDALAHFEREFEVLPSQEEGHSDDERLGHWKSKLKHYMIISSAGKPIWSRHGDPALINSSIGVVHTIISFYEGAKNPLQSFTAGSTKFVVLTQGPLHFVAVTRLEESESQIRGQLDALYMQILSTLTLPTLTRIFANRPSSDLSKPLEGTESLLSSLADSFTKGSPSALLGSLECLKLRKSHRHTINNTFLKSRTENLLYGLIVAGGRLVSVIRPRQHSLHPSDLQLIFNMLFASGGIKAGGGENWIPLCLPAFNNTGYLYMYVSFIDGKETDQPTTPTQDEPASAEREVALVLVSADRESFFELRQMGSQLVKQLVKNGSLARIKQSVHAGRPQIADVAPGSQLSHFLYKSRAHVQFYMSSTAPSFDQGVKRRRLMNMYHELHASAHAKNAHLKVLHSVSAEASALAWVTPAFEFYCIGGPNLSRSALTQGANKIMQWTKREEERLFIVGGGVF